MAITNYQQGACKIATAPDKDHQFWKQDYHPIELNTAEKLKDRLDYLHENPVRSGLVWEPWHYKYSSAVDYYTNEHGLKIEHL